MKTALPYQQIGADFLYTKKRALLADEMGVGKTLQAVLAALKANVPTVVICPASIKVNWAREIIDQDEHAQIQIVEPGNQIHDYATGNGSKWLIVNYDMLDKYGDEGIKLLIDYKTLIVDEAHSIKENTTLRTKATLAIGKHADNIYLITGTPILNRPIELYTLLKLLRHPITLTKQGKDNWYGYAFRYCNGYFREVKRWVFNKYTGKKELKLIRFLEVKGASNIPELRQRIQDIYLRRLKKEVLPLPPKNIHTQVVTMSEVHAKLYAEAWDNYINYLDRIKEELILELGSEEAYDEKLQNIEASKHLVEMQKLQQITSAAKIRSVAEHAYRLAKGGEKVLIFTTYTDTLEKLQRIFKHNKLPVATINGQTKNENRVKAVDAIQEDPNTCLFIGNIKAAGVGITLTKASKVLFIDTEWTPALNQQAEDRAHRYGQENAVDVIYFIAKETIDEDKQKALEAKREVINSILGEGEAKQTASVFKEVLKKSLNRTASLSTLHA